MQNLAASCVFVRHFLKQTSTERYYLATCTFRDVTTPCLETLETHSSFLSIVEVQSIVMYFRIRLNDLVTVSQFPYAQALSCILLSMTWSIYMEDRDFSYIQLTSSNALNSDLNKFRSERHIWILLSFGSLEATSLAPSFFPTRPRSQQLTSLWAPLPSLLSHTLSTFFHCGRGTFCPLS